MTGAALYTAIGGRQRRIPRALRRSTLPRVTAPSRAMVLAALSLAPALARGEARQLQLSLRGGLATSSGALAAPAAALGVDGWYGLNDAFSLYASTGYSLGSLDRGLRHGAHLSAGAVYAFDLIRFVPYLGLGARGDLSAGDQRLVLAPALEVRGGAYYLLRRGIALDLQASYAFPFTGRDEVSDLVTVTFGVRPLNEP